MDLFTSPYVVPVLGLLVGFLGAIAGVGGGFFIVPYLLFSFGLRPEVTSGTSLVLVTLNAVSASIRNILQKQVIFRLGFILGVATIPGAFLGTEIVQGIHVGLFQLGFALLLLGCAAYSIVLSYKEAGEDISRMRVNLTVAIVVSVATGFVSSMFGVGGGVIHVPLMMFAFLVPARMSTATSQFALMITAAVGAGAYIFRDQVIWSTVGLMAPGIVIGAQVGVWASKRVNRRVIRRAFAVICLIVAVEMFYKGVS